MSGESILVIDDSKQIIEHLTERVLPTFGYKTIYAYDGRTGLRIIREQNPDLVILDYNLPEMTGIDVLRKLAQEGINTPVLLMTGYGSEQSAIEAFRLGAKDYIIKPFTVDEIIETIDRALVETRLLHDKQELAEQLRRSQVELSRQSQEMETLFNIGKAITSLLSVDKILKRVLKAAVYLTGAEDSTIWLTNDEGSHLSAYVQGGANENALQIPVEGTQVGQVMRTGRPLRQSDFDSLGVPIHKGHARAVLYVPLTLRGITLGVLDVKNRSGRQAFSRRDEFLLSFLADYAAIALENARVFQAADQALASGLEELNTLIEITRTITASLELDEVVDRTIQQVHDSWQIEASSLWLLDEKEEHLTVLATVGAPHEMLSQFKVPVGIGFVGHVVQTGKWFYSNHASEHELHYGIVDKKTGFSTRSILAVPLTLGGKVVGALELLNKQNGDFNDRDVERALSIAAAVAIAVTNATLFEEAETHKQHLEATLELTANPILITDENNRLVLLNQQARSLLALSPDAVGEPVSEVIEEPELRDVLIGQGERYEEVRLEDGSTWEVRGTKILDNGRILTMQNITSLRELERVKEHFVATVSHDMRSPLNAVIGFADALRSVGSLNEQQQQFADRITKSAEFMLSIVNGLLELARVDTLQQTYQPCDLERLVRSVISEYQDRAKRKDIDLITHIERVPPISGDPNQLRSAVSNLLDNALKYTPQGKEVRLSLSQINGIIQILVSDQGAGIPPTELNRIFDKFYRSTNTQDEPGIGLGLALVKSIAKAHGGEVWAESEGTSRGSTFFFHLPLTVMPQQKNRASSEGNARF